MSNHPLLKDFFRQEYGRLIATLCQKVGFDHLDDVEDAVQSALLKALEQWTHNAMPQHPSAWLYKVASHHILQHLRQKKMRALLLEKHTLSLMNDSDELLDNTLNQLFHDHTLHWLFVCCHPSIATDSQLVFALKTLCGFSIKEIALRLFISEDHAYKRYTRAKKQLKKHPHQLQNFNIKKYLNRTESVNKVLYLMFTEGHLSAHLKQSIRQELCEDAIRLTTLLAELDNMPQSYALLSLMHLQIARFSARVDENNNLLLLAEQDRTLWDKSHINKGFYWLSQSAQGNEFSHYHAQASIAAEHCLAPSFELTRWDKIVQNYALLEKIKPNALQQLNAIVALAQWQGPQKALRALQNFKAPDTLTSSFQWHAVCADLYQRCGHHDCAQSHIQKALSLAPNSAIKDCLEKRFSSH